MTISMRLSNSDTSAIGVVRSRSADLVMVVGTKSAMGLFSCLYLPGNMTDNYRVGAGGYQSDFIGEPELGFDSGI
jgi:uncharacterized NAD-dependent epimerase/dehydratase family protein